MHLQGRMPNLVSEGGQVLVVLCEKGEVRRTVLQV